MAIALNNGFTLTITDPSNILPVQQSALVSSMNYVVRLLTTYIDFKAPLDLEITVKPASQNSGNTDGLLPSSPAWVTYDGKTTLAPIVKANTGVDPNGARPDGGFTIYLGNDGSLKNFGTPFWIDPNPEIGVAPALPAGTTDFIGVAVHELIHCLGFATWPAQNAPWDRNLTKIGADWYYGSPSVNAVLGGLLPIPLYSDGRVSDHVGNVALGYQPLRSDLMYQFGKYAGNRLDIGQIDLLILKDMGYSIKNYQNLPISDPVDSANVSGSNENDKLFASKQSSLVNAGNGDDSITLPTTLGNGNYLIDGGAGSDVVHVARISADYIVRQYGADYILQNKNGADAISLLRSVETISFSDTTITLPALSNDAIGIAIADQLSVVYFGRGVSANSRYATAALVTGGASSDVQKSFFTAAIADRAFGATDSLQTITNKTFKNIFGIDASAFEQDAWAATVSAGFVSREGLPWAMFNSYLGADNVPDSYKIPAQSRIIAVNAFTTAISGAAEATLGAAGASGAEAARAWLLPIRSQSDAAAKVAAAGSAVASLSVAKSGGPPDPLLEPMALVGVSPIQPEFDL